jgi:putative FmdB family regulatory protein
MPVYDYLCADCGPFQQTRPMAEFAAPYPCEGCGVNAPRAILVAPAMSSLEPGRRTAFETNERTANAPIRRSGPPPPSRTARTANPKQRPWMLGH